MKKYYSVYWNSRWTKWDYLGIEQDIYYPFLLTLEEATNWYNRIMREYGSSNAFSVKEVGEFSEEEVARRNAPIKKAIEDKQRFDHAMKYL